MYCKTCGYKLKEGQLICPNCGLVVDSEPIVSSGLHSSKVQTPEKTMVFKTVPQSEKTNPTKYAPKRPEPQKQTPTPQKSPKPNKSNKNKSANVKITILSILLVIMTIACAVLGLNVTGVLPFEKETTITTTNKPTTTSPYNVIFEYETSADQVTITKYIGTESSVIIPTEISGKKVTKIGEKAFYQSLFLETVVIQSSVIEISESAFARCSHLNSVTLPDSLITIGDQAFYGCTNLTYLIIPSTVSNFGKYIFGDCNHLTIECSVASKAYAFCRENSYDYKLRVGESEPSSSEETTLDPSIENATLKNTDFVTQEYPEGLVITSYTGQAVDVAIPSKIDDSEVIGIAANAFSNSFIRKLVIPESIKTIGENAFSNCKNLKSVEFNTKDVVINEGAFLNCHSDLIFTVYENSTAQTYATDPAVNIVYKFK